MSLNIRPARRQVRPHICEPQKRVWRATNINRWSDGGRFACRQPAAQMKHRAIFDPFEVAIAGAVQDGVSESLPRIVVATSDAGVPNWPAESCLDSFVAGIYRQDDAVPGTEKRKPGMNRFDSQTAVTPDRQFAMAED